jgi:SnoaL-like polyketide cyclase
MTTTMESNRTVQLLALMKRGDDAFNARDFAAVDAVHHPDMVAHITGNAQPIYGSVAHAAAMQQMLRAFPDMQVHTPYPVEFGSGDWITVVTRATGTFSGEMVLPDGKVIAPTGKRSTWSSAKARSGTASASSSFRRSGIRRSCKSRLDSRDETLMSYATIREMFVRIFPGLRS